MADKREKPAFLENTPKGTKMFYVRCSMSGYSCPSIEEVTYEGYKTELKRQTYDEYYPTEMHCVWDQAYYNIKFKTKAGKIIKITCDSNSNLCSADRKDHWDNNEHYDRHNDIYFTTDPELLKKYVEESKLVDYAEKRINELKKQIHALENFQKGLLWS